MPLKAVGMQGALSVERMLGCASSSPLALHYKPEVCIPLKQDLFSVSYVLPTTTEDSVCLSYYAQCLISNQYSLFDYVSVLVWDA